MGDFWRYQTAGRRQNCHVRLTAIIIVVLWFFSRAREQPEVAQKVRLAGLRNLYLLVLMISAAGSQTGSVTSPVWRGYWRIFWKSIFPHLVERARVLERASLQRRGALRLSLGREVSAVTKEACRTEFISVPPDGSGIVALLRAAFHLDTRIGRLSNHVSPYRRGMNISSINAGSRPSVPPIWWPTIAVQFPYRNYLPLNRNSQCFDSGRMPGFRIEDPYSENRTQI